MAKKPFTVLNAYMYALLSYSFSFGPSLLFLLNFASQYSCQRSHMVFHLVSGFPHHVIMHPNTLWYFPDSMISAYWLLLCCNMELTGRVLELLVMVYTTAKRGLDPFDMQIEYESIRSLATFSWEFSNNVTIDEL